MTIYYFPIGAETLTPITSVNITERGRHCELVSVHEISAIKNVLENAVRPSTSQKFSNLAVRVKLSEGSEPSDRLMALVENNGSVRFGNGTEGVISPIGMETMKKVIETRCSK